MIPVGYTSSRAPVNSEAGPITTEMSQEAFEQFMSGGGFAAAGTQGGRHGSGSSSVTGGNGGRRSRRAGGEGDVADLEEVSGHMLFDVIALRWLIGAGGTDDDYGGNAVISIRS